MALIQYPFTPCERRASISLAAVMSLRLLGVFMLLPVFSLYAQQIMHASTTQIGLALGIYGLMQALLQLPMGIWSDYVPRRRVIVFGLILFIAGSLLAVVAQSIGLLILARALQGAGAIGSACSALLADFTRDSRRTKAMAILGISVGLAFTLGLIMGPMLQQWLSVPALFAGNAILGVLSIIILYQGVPNTIPHRANAGLLVHHALRKVLQHMELQRLNLGIFCLHAILTALFLALPLVLAEQDFAAGQQWHIYLPALLGGGCIMLPLLRMSEQPGKLKGVFLIAAIGLGISLLGILSLHKFTILLIFSLLIFFASFTLLEALLPSLISRLAPPTSKGTALGVFSSVQFLGIFVGGSLGGWLYSQAGLTAVCSAAILLVFLSILAVINMRVERV